MDYFLSQVDQILGDKLVDTLSNVFHFMDIAEEEIDEAELRFPDKADRINDFFVHLYPGKHLETWAGTAIPDAVYRSHCCELLERVAKNEDTTLGTDAEVLCTVSGASFSTLLNVMHSHIYGKCFLSVFGSDEVDRLFGDDSLDDQTKLLKQSTFFIEQYDGAYEEHVIAIRKRIKSVSRKL